MPDSLIYVLNKRVALHQAPNGFRTSMDSVMLAAACPAQDGDTILDLGCGVGSAGLCVLERVAGTTLIGIDVQDNHLEIAQKNAIENALQDRTKFLNSDVRNHDGTPAQHVICNPPYKEAGQHKASPSTAKAIAMGHQEGDLTLQSWTTCAWNHIKGQGSLTMVHEAGKTDEIIRALYSARGRRRFGDVQIIPLFPKKGEPAKRVIIRAWKHRKSPATIHPGIIMHTENGTHTKEANDVLRHAASL